VHDDEKAPNLVTRATRTAKEVDDFGIVRGAWRQLESNAHYFFQYPQWLQVIASLADGDVAWGVLAESGETVAASVLQRRRVGPSLLGLRALTNVRVNAIWMYPFTDCLIDPAAARAHGVVLDDVLDASGTWHAALITNLRAESPWLHLAVGRAQVRHEESGGVGILDTRHDVDAWQRTLPKNMRDTIRKTRKRVATAGGAQITVATQSDVPAAYERFIALEASGWKGAHGTSISQSGAWCELLGHYLESTKSAQIRSLYIDGRIAASQLCVTVGTSLVLLKVAYDEQLAQLSPGNLLMANLAEECCEDPLIDRIDCTVWQDWHQRWGMYREPTFDLFAFDHRTWRGKAIGAAWNARRALTRQNSWKVAPATPITSR